MPVLIYKCIYYKCICTWVHICITYMHLHRQKNYYLYIFKQVSFSRFVILSYIFCFKPMPDLVCTLFSTIRQTIRQVCNDIYIRVYIYENEYVYICIFIYIYIHIYLLIWTCVCVFCITNQCLNALFSTIRQTILQIGV
jgi:hypothetical protein